MRAAPLVASAVLTFAGLVAQEGRHLSYPDLLQRTVDPSWLCRPPAAGERSLQFSSYDRRSDAGPSDFDAWYANDDRGNYLRVEERDGRKEYVMVDFDGPGVMSRLWSANPSGELFVYVDGELVWTVDFRALTSGEIDPIGGALAGVRARGANCYLPIPFAEHLKVTASKNDFYYQCNVTRFAPGTTVDSFAPALLERHADAIRAAAVGARPSELPRGGAAPIVSMAVPAGCVLTEFGINLTGRVPEGQQLGDLLRKIVLVVHCGREETVRVPVLDFFCGGADWYSYATRFLWIDDNKAGCRFPMPMPEGGELRLESEDDLPLHASLDLVRYAGLTIDDPLLFRAGYHQRKDFESRPFHDFTILDAAGRGRFVGCSLLVKNPTRAWWGEGDEKFWVDGEDFPSTFGTGTEDYFGYAWCSPEPFDAAFHTQNECDGPGNYGFTALHRTQLLDSVPFQRSFRFDLEVWHWVENKRLDYTSVAYWYGASGATSGLPPLPPAAERTLDRLGPPPVFVAEGVIEGESLRVVAVTGGEHEVQDMAHFENQFSRDAQRWWKHGKPGDTLVLAVPVAEAGRYRVSGAFCTANDYGTVQLTLEDQKLGAPLEGYATRVQSTGQRELGEVELDAGEAMLRVTILGKHGKALPAYMFGLDYLRLEKLP
ncbi:MAG: DUF2961 domain-containing protein [Planctomycetes bacterium]|nr:DUF2961 domain-containing protein [Planctomycetota bacterium]